MTTSNNKRVAVLGGGVAGLSAAHELIKHGYQVDVYEARADLGGKARSQYIKGTAAGGRRDLPGEHGFRFYPSFYKHLIRTMEEIPLDVSDPNGKKVADNLRSCNEAGIAPADGVGMRRFLRRKPKDALDFVGVLQMVFRDIDVSPLDLAFFAKKVLRYFASCKKRRDSKYEEISWWSYVEGHSYEPRFQKYLRAVPRIMVAMDPKHGSARTIGNISMQLIEDYAKEGIHSDRTLIGPTTEAWILPWRTYLESLGVTFHTGRALKKLSFDPTAGRITGAVVAGEAAPIQADYYICAVPLEVMVDLVTAEMASFDERELGKLRRIYNRKMADSSGVLSDRDQLGKMTDWMVGLQLFLREDRPLVRGHVFFPDSPWALSAISQAQFWEESQKGFFRERYGDGEVGGVLSVDISDWNREGVHIKKPAKRCTADEIRAEVWEQIKAGLNKTGETVVTDALLYPRYNLDQDVEFPEGSPAEPRNSSPLLVHPPGSWFLRPTAETGIENLMLASDYVQTETILACMEGANEAARHAVNAILRRDRGARAACDVWCMEEHPLFERAKQIDEMAFDRGYRGDASSGPQIFSDVQSFFDEGEHARPTSLEEVENLERMLVANPELV
jgi:15-cis-phytoene desaturase